MSTHLIILRFNCISKAQLSKAFGLSLKNYLHRNSLYRQIETVLSYPMPRAVPTVFFSKKALCIHTVNLHVNNV